MLFLAACGPALPPQKSGGPPRPEAPAPVASAPSPTRPAAPPAKQAPTPGASAPAAAAKPAPPPPSPKPPAPESTRPASPPLDLKSLETRLKETGAIGVLTKLSLKNQVDDLVDRFLAFHSGKRPPTLSELRSAYELLLMKALSLLQDKDAALARDINDSREAIWSLLTDGQKLTRYK